MSSSYNPPLPPLYPDLEDQQDEELQKVLQLSLITAQEDEVRRRRNHPFSEVDVESRTKVLQSSDSVPDLISLSGRKPPFETSQSPTVLSVVRPRPEPNRNFGNRDLQDGNMPLIPKPVVPVGRGTVAAKVASMNANVVSGAMTLQPRPKADLRDTEGPVRITVPPRPPNWPSTPDPNQRPFAVLPGSQSPAIAAPDLLNHTSTTIAIPPRPVCRSRPDLTAGPGAIALRSQSVPPPLKPEAQDAKATADTFLIELSPPPTRLTDFSIDALDPYRPQVTTRATCIPVPPRPVGYCLPNEVQRVTVSGHPNVVESSTPAGIMPGSARNPAYGLIWPPVGMPPSGPFYPDGSASASSSTSRISASDIVDPDNDDLMSFTESRDDPIYLTLEDFDPLFLTADQKSISSGRSGFYATLNRSKSDAPGNAATPLTEPISNRARSDGYEELLDPFSISDLTLSLERKRQRHNAEQELRKTLKRAPEVGTKDESRSITGRDQVTTNRPTKEKQESSYERLEEFSEKTDDEIKAFIEMVSSIKLENSVEESLSNAGYVISPRMKHIFFVDLTVKVTVSGVFFVDPVVFTCDVNTVVEHIITHVVVMLNDNLGGASADDFLLKVHGLSEYLINNSILADYDYVQQCLKLDKDIHFVLCQSSAVSRPFKQHAEDGKAVFVRKIRAVDDQGTRVTREKLNILMETFYKEVEKLRDATIQGAERVHCNGVVQAVTAICTILQEMQTVDIMKAVQRLKAVLLQQPGGRNSTSTTSPRDREAFNFNAEDVNPTQQTDLVTMLDDLHIALDEVTKAVKTMIEMYCRTFHTDFNFESSKCAVREVRDTSGLQESFIIHLATVHRIPSKWKQLYTEYKIKISLYYGGRPIADEIFTMSKSSGADSYQGTIIWDEWIQFDKVLSSLPRETKIMFELIGVRMVQSNTSDGHLKVNVALGWVAVQLYNEQFELVQGSHLLGLWLHTNANPFGTTGSNTENSDSVLVQVNLPKFDYTYVFPSVQDSLPSLKQDIDSLEPVDLKRLQAISAKDILTPMTSDESALLWEKRYHLQSVPRALFRFLQSVTSWSSSSLPRIYAMVKEWAPAQPLEGLQLLLPSFTDSFVRKHAVTLLRRLSADEVYDLLPQLVQALKFEHYHKSELAVFLLEHARSNVRIAHQLYWLFKEAADSEQYKKRYELMFGALLSIVGAGMREEFQKQEDLVKMLATIADKVKSEKDKETILERELYKLCDLVQDRTVRLPINPAIEVSGVDVKVTHVKVPLTLVYHSYGTAASCSFFTSFTCPLKLALKNAEAQAGNIYTMFKAGDDLRQDMLTLQMIQIMDQLWMQEGLDLKMLTFRCQHTGPKRGLVELLMESDTLRKIQIKHGHGLAGSFKDRPIAEWLQLHNPTEMDYQKAVENFTESCAGYCVATYILGICDRHNDNIMIKHSGHIFHIDFAKYLGDAQKFGNFKRDRTPFVLTSDMVYVINGGDKTSQNFQHFIDLCCRAFNIVRKHSNLLLTLFSLMTVSGIPGITHEAPRYIQKVLLTERSDTEAVADFTKMIHTSLESVFTQLNFFLHNLAQMRFFGHEEGALLSFIPKTYSIVTDGKLRNLEMYGIQKRYSPEKYYIYIVKIERENQRVPSFVMRRYSEFQELHRKLEMTFPLVRLPSLSGKRVMGRSHVRPVAENRKSEIEAFMKELLKLAPEVAQHDLIYTFFHPMLRDEQDISKCNLPKLKESAGDNDHLQNRRIEGAIKLNLFYKQGTFTIMVMHVKDLGKTSSGEAPNPYVKLYLLPDFLKETKRKTKVARNTYNPTYNEMLCYRKPLERLNELTLQVTVWSYEALKENEFLGAAHVKLSELDLTRECPAWHKLQTLHVLNSS